MRVLVAEDEQRLADILQQALMEDGHAVTIASDGLRALQMASLGAFDVLSLDWMLPGMDGPTVCRSLREQGVSTPVILLTARGEVVDRVTGLDALADDFLAKPFSLPEYLARVRALGRRAQPPAAPAHRIGDLTVDEDRRTVHRGEVAVQLTAREFDVLVLLARGAGAVVPRRLLIDEVWDRAQTLRSNALDVHIATLRAKLDKPFGRSSIRTQRAVGFWLAAEDS